MNKKTLTLLFVIFSLVFASLACGGSTTPAATVPEDSDNAITQVASEPASESAEPTSTIAPLGSDPSNPAPLGVEVTLDEWTLMVVDVTRPADDIVFAGDASNPTPEPDSEFILVTVSATCNMAANETCSLSADYDFDASGSQGVVYDVRNFFISGVDGLLEVDGIPGGTTVTGGLIFAVSTDDTDLILIFEPYLTSVYLALE